MNTRAKSQSHHFSESALPVIAGLLAVVLVAFPVLSGHVNVTHDGLFHLARVQSLSDALEMGIFPVKVHPSLLYTYGYGVGFFYPNLFLYLPAGLMRLGISLDAAYHIYVLFAVVVAYLAAYTGVRHLTNDRIAGVVAGIVLFSSAFYQSELYDGSIGTYTAMGLMFLAACGLIGILEQKKGSNVLFCAGLVGVLQSHSISFFILMITGVLLCLLCVKMLARCPKIIKEILLCGIVSALLSANYLFPAFEQIAHQRFRGQTELQSVPLYEKTLSVATMLHRLGAVPTVVFALCVAATVFLYLKKESVLWQIRLIVLILLLTATVCFPPFWKLTYRYFAFFQYPVRMLNVVTPLIAIFAGRTLAALKRFLPAVSAPACTVLILLLSAVGAFVGRGGVSSSHFPEERVVLSFTQEEFDDAVSRTGREWHPVEMHTVFSDNPETSYTRDNHGADGIKHDNGAWYEVWLEMERGAYRIPYTYYYGYRAFLTDEEGAPGTELVCEKADNGLLEVLLPEGNEGIGHVIVRYEKTAVQWAGFLVSLLMIAGILMIRLRCAGAFRK